MLLGGYDYRLLKPTYAIWLIGKNLIKTDNNYLHVYKLRDEKSRILTDHGGIWLFELEKFSTQYIENEQQRWLQFFKKADQFDDKTLPDWMNTKEMRQAMSTLQRFSEKERDYHAYQARQNFIREQNTMRGELEEALAREEAALKALEEKDATLQKHSAEIDRLKALLADRTPTQ